MGASPTEIRFPVLIGDIGGTNARFALIAGRDAAVVRIADVHTADHATIGDAIDAAVLRASALRPKTAILALAGPIAGEHIHLTNCDWVVEPKALIARFGLSDVILLNDFEALSLCLPGLGAEDVDPIGEGAALAERARIVVGPGTGLGAGASGLCRRHLDPGSRRGRPHRPRSGQRARLRAYGRISNASSAGSAPRRSSPAPA